MNMTITKKGHETGKTDTTYAIFRSVKEFYFWSLLRLSKLSILLKVLTLKLIPRNLGPALKIILFTARVSLLVTT